MGICHGLFHREEMTTSSKNWKKLHHRDVLLLMEDFKHLNVSWKRNGAWHNQPKRLLEYVDNNVLMLCRQVDEEGCSAWPATHAYGESGG